MEVDWVRRNAGSQIKKKMILLSYIQLFVESEITILGGNNVDVTNMQFLRYEACAACCRLTPHHTVFPKPNLVGTFHHRRYRRYKWYDYSKTRSQELYISVDEAKLILDGCITCVKLVDLLLIFRFHT